MTSVMLSHTRRLAVTLALLMALFVVLSTSLAALLRYRESLETLLDHHRTIRRNLTEMRKTIFETRDSITGFKRLLPNGYGQSSPQMLLYRRLDEVKTKLPSGEMAVNLLETKEGMLSLGFSLKPYTTSYGNLINTLGQLELAVFPFVSIRGISLESPAAEKPGPITITVEGALLTQAPATDATALPVTPTPPQSPATMGAP